MARRAIGPRALFVSYRRSDSQPWTGRLADDLRDHFGRARVYRDLDVNRAAVDFRAQVADGLAQARAVVAVIGPTWTSIRGSSGAPRLAEGNDLVRLELEWAFGQGVPLVPVLVGGASMPLEAQLPGSIRSLARLQGLRLGDEDWRYDMGRLIEVLEGFGVTPGIDDEKDEHTVDLTAARSYERTFRASRRRAFDAVAATVELLHYPRKGEQPEAAKVVFEVMSREVSCSVVDSGPGSSRVVVTMRSVRTGLLAGGSAGASMLLFPFLGPLGVALASGPAAALRGWERRFCRGFLDNIGSILEGRGIIEDPAQLPGVSGWRNRRREV
jgi:hypothetical protein